jgi:hypothetical protein
MLLSQPELPLDLQIPEKRIVRLELTKKQIALLVEYAIKNGFQKRHPNSNKMELAEENSAAKYTIMQRLGF